MSLLLFCVLGRESGCSTTELKAVRTLPSRLEKKLPTATRKNDKEQPFISELLIVYQNCECDKSFAVEKSLHLIYE